MAQGLERCHAALDTHRVPQGADVQVHVVFPMLSLERGGGCRVVVELANGLVRRGHAVTVVMPREGRLDWRLDAALTRVDQLLPQSLPPCDVLVPNFWPTVEPAFRSGKGAVVRLSLGYEPLWVPNASAARDTYRLPIPLISISQWHRNLMLEKVGVDSTVIPPGVDLGIFRPLPGAARPLPPRVLYIYRSRAHGYWWKGQEIFFAAMREVARQIPGVNLQLVMAEVERPEMDVPCPYQAFSGLSDVQLATLYARADVFVSSPRFEAFSLPPLEAMASGCAAVTTDCGGVHEYVQPSRNALMVPPDDPPKLARAILAVLRNPALAEGLRQEGVRTAQMWSWDIAVARFEQFLWERAGAPKGRSSSWLQFWGHSSQWP
jgi:glycosyltransferase involved in cell wall biosynthesis